MTTPPIRKAVIPVAGLGTRVLPATKVIPKEMLAIIDKPAIQYVVEEAAAAGITEIIFITRSGKEAVEEHFGAQYELESILEQKGKTKLLEKVRGTLPEGLTITSVRQEQALGLGHAVHCAKSAVGNEPFAVLLPDVILGNPGELQRMVSQYEQTGAGQIMVEQVPHELVYRYGIVDCKATPEPGQSAGLNALVEKPDVADAPSDLAVVGRYILPSTVMQLLEQTQPGAGNEIQLTDALVDLLSIDQLEAYRTDQPTFDCGNKLGYVLANVFFANQDPEIGSQIFAAVNQLNT